MLGISLSVTYVTLALPNQGNSLTGVAQGELMWQKVLGFTHSPKKEKLPSISQLFPAFFQMVQTQITRGEG